MASGTGSPCGACKFLRRKCTADCIFAPYFSWEQGAARFAAIHKVFGASNVSKLLLHVPLADRCEAVVAIAYEAQARMKDPVYGCVGHIFSLQQQVENLQLQLMQAKAQLAQSLINSQTLENQYIENAANPLIRPYLYKKSLSPQSSLDCIDQNPDGLLSMQEMLFRDGLPTQRGVTLNEVGELQALASKMLKN